MAQIKSIPLPAAYRLAVAIIIAIASDSVSEAARTEVSLTFGQLMTRESRAVADANKIGEQCGVAYH